MARQVSPPDCNSSSTFFVYRKGLRRVSIAIYQLPRFCSAAAAEEMNAGSIPGLLRVFRLFSCFELTRYSANNLKTRTVTCVGSLVESRIIKQVNTNVVHTTQIIITLVLRNLSTLKVVWYNLEVSHWHHVCNSWLLTVCLLQFGGYR